MEVDSHLLIIGSCTFQSASCAVDIYSGFLVLLTQCE